MRIFNRGNFVAAAMFVCAALVLPGCEDRYDTEPNPSAFFWLMSAYDYNSYGHYANRTSELEDMGDGTVKFVVTPRQYRSDRYPNTITRHEVIVRKCPQGFDYDAGSDACTLNPMLPGGDAKLRFCDADNNSCNDLNGALNAAGNSEMYNSCTNETTDDLSWRPAYRYTIHRLMEHPRFDEIFPDLKDQWVFTNQAVSTAHAAVYRTGLGNDVHAKTRGNYVLCEYPVSEYYPAATSSPTD